MRGGGYASRIVFTHTYEDIISVENLLAAWQEFVRGKRQKRDVQDFQHRLMDNILALHRDLKNKTYRHGAYEAFKINDPKPRDIHKATVRDRLLHHALYRQLYPFFDRTFIADSYSCRKGKGTHKAMDRFRSFAYQASKNHTRTVWVLKCDIRKFFASIDQAILLNIVEKYIPDKDINWLISEIVVSFQTHTTMPIGRSVCMGRKGLPDQQAGLPLGNLTSQLLVNIYMNEFDQFVKHKLKVKHYVRYADDFVVLSHDRAELDRLLSKIESFLQDKLKLQLHPDKVSISTFASGVDFLGWVHFPDHRVLRTSTKRRMMRGIVGLEKDDMRVRSYLGLLLHGNAGRLAVCVDSLCTPLA
ncbi:group II intron reverse transcriptase domain-containing protein [Candidatus Kaiserbacteria bacterium]|nr:group II intron reverse transcriptase domain-containing protein [Candidatus Kaiserbacteria bacterium]